MPHDELQNEPEICTTIGGGKQHLSTELDADTRSPRRPGRWGRTMCGHAGYDQERVDYMVTTEQMSRCKPITSLTACRTCFHAAARQRDRMFLLSDEQLDALRALLGLVRYDDTATKWLDILPTEFHPTEKGPRP